WFPKAVVSSVAHDTHDLEVPVVFAVVAKTTPERILIGEKSTDCCFVEDGDFRRILDVVTGHKAPSSQKWNCHRVEKILGNHEAVDAAAILIWRVLMAIDEDRAAVHAPRQQSHM